MTTGAGRMVADAVAAVAPSVAAIAIRAAISKVILRILISVRSVMCLQWNEVPYDSHAMTAERSDSTSSEASWNGPTNSASALSVVERPDRAPLTVPIWYHYAPGGELWVITPPDSRKARAIAVAGRFSLMVQRLEPTVRYVSVEGPVVRTAPGSHELSWEMAVSGDMGAI